MRSLLMNRTTLEEIIGPYVPQLSKDGYFIEIGIYRGGGMATWIKYFEKAGKEWTYIGVDPFLLAGGEDPQEVKQEAYRTLSNLTSSKWHIREKKSDEFWETSVFDENVNFVLIDGDHSDDFVKRDCINTKLSLAQKAIVIMDDVHNLSSETRQWVIDFWGSVNIVFVDGQFQQFVIFHGITQ